MNDEIKKGMNAAERERCRTALSDNRVELRRAKRAAADDAQAEKIQARLDKNELARARINRLGLQERDNDDDVVARIGAIEDAVNELRDEVDAFEVATDKARKFASVIASADKALGSIARLTALVV